MANRHVKGLDDAPEVLNLRRGPRVEYGVGALVDHGVAAVGKPPVRTAAVVEQGPKVRRPGVADLDVLSAHRRQGGGLLFSLQAELLGGGDFRRRGHVHHIAQAPLVEPCNL